MSHVVLVHGAWVGADSWDRVADQLRHDNTVDTVSLPLTGLADDATVVRAAIERAPVDDVVLVGHSYGGSVISAAGQGDPTVRRLVYVAAVANDEGESANDLVALFPPTPAAPEIVVDERSRMTIRPEKFGEVFAQDVDRALSAELADRQNPTHVNCFGDALLGVPAWRTTASTFVVSTEDRVVSPLLQAYQAGRMGARVVAVAASHASPLSTTDAVVEALRSAEVMA